MTSQRDILFITTSEDDALNARLATQSAPVSEAAQDAFDIEVFTHVYDAQRARAWLDRAGNPILPGGITVAQAAATLTDRVLPTAQAVNAAWSGATVTDVPRAPQLGELPVDVTQPLYRVIDRLSPQQQYDVVMGQLDALSKAFRSLNLSPLAIPALQRVHERLWGYMDPRTDGYLTGIGGSLIENRVQVFAYTFGRQWRDYLSNWYNRRVRQQIEDNAREFGPGEVLIGFLSDYRAPRAVVGIGGVIGQQLVGCRPASDESIVAPSSCYAPTCEVHRVWWQTNGAMSGGRAYPPAEMASTVAAINYTAPLTIRIGYDRAIPDGGTQAWDWNTAVFEPVTTPGTPWRLYVLPPLVWYWAIYFQPQPEFGGMSFVDWALSMSPSEFIRLQRRGTTRANAEMASFWNTTVEGLIGQALSDASTEQANAVRRRNAALTLVGTGSDAVANAVGTAAKDTPIVGLIAGVSSQVIKVIGEILKGGNENDKISVDVYGRLMPAFVIFAIYSSKSAFDAAMVRSVPLPVGVPGTTAVVGTVVTDNGPRVGVPTTSTPTTSRPTTTRRPSTVSLASLRNATTAPVQIHGMPWYGGVAIDGAHVDGVWKDAEKTLWEVRTTPGNRQVRVTAPDGTARDFSVSIPAAGVLLDMSNGAVVPMSPLLSRDAQNPPDASMLADGTWSTSTVTPPFVTAPGQSPEPSAPSAKTWGNAALVLLAAGATAGTVYAARSTGKRTAHASKANKRRRT